MAPAADTDAGLLGLQVAVAEARALHADLGERAALMERTRHFASAQALRIKRDRAAIELRKASEKLADYISKRQRGLKR